MQLTISQFSLDKALQTAMKVVSAKAPHPVLAGALLRASDGVLEVRATDMSTSVATKVPANVIEGGSVVVPAKLFSTVVKSLPDTVVSVEIDGRYLKVSCGKSLFRLVTMEADDFPELPEPDFAGCSELPVALLSELCSKTSRFVSKDDGRPILKYVQMSASDGDLRIVSTDSYRLAVCEGLVSEICELTALVDGKFLGNALKLADPAGNVVIGATGATVSMAFGDTVFTTRKMDGNYPDWRRLVPQVTKTVATVEANDLMNSVRRVSTVLGANNPSVTITITSVGVHLSADSAEGSSAELVEGSVSGEDVTFGVNAKFLADAVASMEDGEVSIECNGPVNPIVMKSYGAVNYLHLLMPMHI